MEHLTQHIESLIFTTEHPISIEEILSVLEETFETVFEVETLEKTLSDLKDRYKKEDFSFELVEIANGFQFLTKGAYHKTVGTYLKQTTKKRLSRAAIETLSMVAYKQPVSKSELEKIRGVSCDYSIQKLLEKELVTILGRADTPGRPLLYGTTEKFMDYFGIKSLKDLPKPKDFKTPDSEIGEAAPIEEEVPESNEEQSVIDPAAESEAVSLDESSLPNEDKLEVGSILETPPEEEPTDGILKTDVSLETLDGAFEQEEE